MILSRTQKDLGRLAQAIDGHMNLRADAAARTSELLLLRSRVLLPGRMLMGSNYRGIQHQHLQIRIAERLEDPPEHAFLAPAVEALKHSMPVAEALGHIPPGDARFSDKEDSINEKPIVLGRHAWVAVLPRQQLFDGVPLFVRQFMASQHAFCSSAVKYHARHTTCRTFHPKPPPTPANFARDPPQKKLARSRKS